MRILYIHQYFKTPKEGGPLRSYHLAKALTEAGHEVVMLCSHNESMTKQETVDGFEVHRLPVYYENKLGFYARIRSFLKFVRFSKKYASDLGDFDLCYASSTPLSVGKIALYLKKMKGVPFIFEARDLWPDAPIKLGFLRNPYLKSVGYKLEKRIYREAKTIVALSPGAKEAIQKKSGRSDVYLVPNMADTDFFDAPEIGQVDRFSKETPFRIVYFGALGIVNGLERFIALAQEFDRYKNETVKFTIVGEGGETDYIQALIKSKRLDNIEYLGFKNRNELQQLLHESHASYISFLDNPVLELNSPNKFFDSLAAGLVCLVNFGGWIEHEIEAHGCGLYLDPKDHSGSRKLLTDLIMFPEQVDQIRKKSRELGEQKYSKKSLSDSVVKIIASS